MKFFTTGKKTILGIQSILIVIIICFEITRIVLMIQTQNTINTSYKKDGVYCMSDESYLYNKNKIGGK